MTDWSLNVEYDPISNVCITHILRRAVEVAHVYRTYHPTIPYEVHWCLDGVSNSRRANTIEECIEIIRLIIGD